MGRMDKRRQQEEKSKAEIACEIRSREGDPYCNEVLGRCNASYKAATAVPGRNGGAYRCSSSSSVQNPMCHGAQLQNLLSHGGFHSPESGQHMAWTDVQQPIRDV